MRFWKIAAAVGVLAASAAVGTGAPPAKAGQTLLLKRFLLGRLENNTDKFIATGASGTTNAFRDNVIQLVFTAPVWQPGDTPEDVAIFHANLNSRTVKIGVPASPTEYIQAQGTFYKYSVKALDPISGTYQTKRYYRNRVIFDPTSRNEEQIHQNPYGLLNNSLYTVSIPGTDTGATKTVVALDGTPNSVTFTTTFHTTDSYLQDYKQPTIVKVEAVDAPGIPLDGRTTVNSRADIVATFSEPMLPSTFDPKTSFRVFNASQGQFVTGTIRPAPDGLSFTYRVAFGYGRGPSNVQVSLTTALKDRSGNALDKGATVNFVSQFDPNAPSFLQVIEDFVTNTYEDTTFTLSSPDNGRGAWNKPANQGGIPGSLVAVAGVKQLELTFTLQNGDGLPWFYVASRTQQLYSAAQMGNTPRTITGFMWNIYPGYNVGGATYNGTTVAIGHNTNGNVSAAFTSFSDTPVTTTNNVAYKVSSSESIWYTGPTFSTNWSYNGRDNAVLDIQDQGSGSTGQIGYWQVTQSAPQGGTVRVRQSTAGGLTSGTYSWSTNIRFLYLVDKSEAQSKWYDTGVTSPNYLDPILQQVKPAGTIVIVTYQGARENPLVPGQADPANATPWSSDPVTDLSGYRFIRFNVNFKSNLSAGTNPQVDSVTMPFIYF